MTIDFKDPKVVKVARSMCLGSMKFYIKLFFFVQYKRKFVWNDHHDKIVDALWDVLTGKTLRLIINVAPRYSKTEIVVKAFISFVLGFNPKAKFIHLSYGDDIALDNSETIKDLIESEEYQAIFPGITIKRDSKSKKKWYTNHGGGLLARSAAGQVTGFGAGEVDTEEEFEIMDFADTIISQNVDSFESDLEKILKFAGAIVIDDPIKPEDAGQETIRRRVNDRFDSTIRNRVNSRRTPIILIQQRLHPLDLSGYVQRVDDEDDWVVVSLPCLIEDKSAPEIEIQDWDDEGRQVIIKKRWKALWSFKHTVAELLKKRKSNEIVFENQYMQNAQPKTGLMFPSQMLNFFDIKETQDEDFAEYIYIPVDPANLGGDDFAALVAKLHGSKIYITDVLYNLDGEDINAQRVVKLALQTKASMVGVEGVFGWKETVDKIKAELSSKNFQGDVRQLRPRTAKHVRISSKQSFIRNNFCFRKDYDQFPAYFKFMQNLTTYKKIQEPGAMNKHDEAPDVCEMAATHYSKTFPELWELNVNK